MFIGEMLDEQLLDDAIIASDAFASEGDFEGANDQPPPYLVTLFTAIWVKLDAELMLLKAAASENDNDPLILKYPAVWSAVRLYFRSRFRASPQQ